MLALIGVGLAIVALDQDAGPKEKKPESSDRDCAVLETVLIDLLETDPFIWSRKPAKKERQILVHEETPEKSGMLGSGQIATELRKHKGKSIPEDAEEDLRNRNRKQGSWKKFKPNDARIVVTDLDKCSLGSFKPRNESKPWVFDKYPDAIAHVRAWRAGYSKDRNRAVVRFWIGPSPHGAAGTYLLVRKDGKWHVKWKNIAYFA